MSTREVNVGVVGATGLVGQAMLGILSERNFPVGDLRVFASERSAGQELSWGDRLLIVEDVGTAALDGMDIVLFSAGATVSRRLAPQFASQGAVVVDNSSAWRRDADVPLIVSEVNPDDLDCIPMGIVANPNCTTMIAMPVLKPLHAAAELCEMVVASYQAASGAGQRGVEELAAQTLHRMGRSLGVTDEIGERSPKVFPLRMDGNVIPLRGKLVDRETDEEKKLRDESRKILGIGNLSVSATCVSVPVDVGHTLAIEAIFGHPISPDEAEAILSSAEGVRLVDIPNPLDAVGGDVSLVGRIRESGIESNYGLSLVVCGDNLRKGAALNAVQIAELLLPRL